MKMINFHGVAASIESYNAINRIERKYSAIASKKKWTLKLRCFKDQGLSSKPSLVNVLSSLGY